MNKDIINQTIKKIVPPYSRVLDAGCGKGELLCFLKQERSSLVTGIDLNQENIIRCVEKGLSVIHGDISEILKNLSSHSFDYVIISQTLQTLVSPLVALFEALRVGKDVVLCFPNFAHFRVRSYFLFGGRMPRSQSLSYEWYNTPNIHLHTYRDVVKVCENSQIQIKEKIFFSEQERLISSFLFPNLLAENVILVLSKNV